MLITQACVKIQNGAGCRLDRNEAEHSSVEEDFKGLQEHFKCTRWDDLSSAHGLNALAPGRVPQPRSDCSQLATPAKT